MMGDAAMIDLDDAGFAAFVAAQALPALVVFSATWCAPCRAMVEELPALAASVGGFARVGLADVDRCPQAVMAHRPQGVPMLALFVGGEVVALRLGGLKRRAIRSWLVEQLDAARGAHVDRCRPV